MTNEPKRRGRPPKAETDLRRNNPTFRCTDDLLDRLKQAAEANSRSMNREIEERLENSFKEEEMNMQLLRHMYGLDDPVPTVFDMAMLWSRAETTADRKVVSKEKWFENAEKREIFIDYYQSSIRRFLLGIAAREKSAAQAPEATQASGQED